ncbi:hypothetical protein GZL_09164 [Streptomyces sp. 769]|nr:hypothetical protein GZL_09164 [Streptomyces sp. 769]
MNTHRRFSSTASSEAGNVTSGSIGGLLFGGGNITDASLPFRAISP